MKGKRWIFAISIGGGVAFAGLNVMAYRHAFAMTHFSPGGQRTNKPESMTLAQRFKVIVEGVNLPRPESLTRPETLNPPFKSVKITVGERVSLGAWYHSVSESSDLVILFHGYGGEKSSMVPEANALVDMGYSVLLVDFRGCGESSESYTTLGFKEGEDVAAALDYAREQFHHKRITLFGSSMGAAAVLRAIHANGAKPDAIIIDAVFDSMINMVRHRFDSMKIPSFPSAELLVFWGGWQCGFDAFKHNPVEYADSVQCPTLFLHGGDDPRARVTDARRVFSAVKSPKLFKEFPGAMHEPLYRRFPNEWKNAVGAFLKSS